MARKPAYDTPSRKGKVALVCYVTPAVRDALKIHAIRTGTSIQELLEKAAEAIVAKAEK
jgi:hypothetical protein